MFPHLCEYSHISLQKSMGVICNIQEVPPSAVFTSGAPGPAILAEGVVGGAGNGGARARARYELGILLCSVSITALLEVGSFPKLL